MDAALHRGLTSLPELRRWLCRLEGRPHTHAARASVDLADARTESPGESRTRLVLGALGFGNVEPQVTIGDGFGELIGRVDFLLRDRVVIEFDGLLKYDGADGREALGREKRREDALADRGYQVVRVIWAELDRPRLLLRRVESALARSAGPVERW